MIETSKESKNLSYYLEAEAYGSERNEVHKQDEEKSSNHHTFEFLNCFETDPTKETNVANFIINSFPSSFKSSLNMSKEFEVKKEKYFNDILQNNRENLIEEFEERWKCIELSKISRQYNNNSIKRKSSCSKQINLKKKTYFKCNNYNNKTFNVGPNIFSKNNNFSLLENQNEDDFDILIKSLNHKETSFYNYEKYKQNEDFIKLKNDSKSYVQSTKPSINSFASNSLSVERNITGKHIDKKGGQRNKNELNSNDKKVNIIMSPTLKEKFINTYEDIMYKREQTMRNCNYNKNETKLKFIMDRYKDLNSMKKNFYTILNDLNLNITKAKKISVQDSIKAERSYPKNLEVNFKKNKNYLKIEKNFSMIDQLHKGKNISIGDSNQKKFDILKVNPKNNTTTKRISLLRKRQYNPNSPKKIIYNISTIDNNLNNKIGVKVTNMEKTSMFNKYKSFLM